MFMGPFHATNLDPTYAMERDLQLVMLLDRLGYDEAWIASITPAALRSSLRLKFLLPRRRSARSTSDWERV